MNTDGTNQINLTNSPAFDWYPDWSPDGEKIIFGSYSNASNPEDEDIYVMSPDGTNFEQLTRQMTIDEPLGGGVPRWSPNGSKIVFQSEGKEGLDIYTMNADGTNRVNLTNNPGGDWYASWSPIQY